MVKLQKQAETCFYKGLQYNLTICQYQRLKTSGCWLLYLLQGQKLLKLHIPHSFQSAERTYFQSNGINSASPSLFFNKQYIIILKK